MIRPNEKATSHVGEENLLPAPNHFSGFVDLSSPKAHFLGQGSEVTAGGEIRLADPIPVPRPVPWPSRGFYMKAETFILAQNSQAISAILQSKQKPSSHNSLLIQGQSHFAHFLLPFVGSMDTHTAGHQTGCSLASGTPGVVSQAGQRTSAERL